MMMRHALYVLFYKETRENEIYGYYSKKKNVDKDEFQNIGSAV